MTNSSPQYVVDSDVLIQAHRSYYAFDICSGFWNAIINHQHIVASIDKVFDEINAGSGQDELKRWVRNQVQTTFFLSTNDSDVTNQYGLIVNWVNGRPYTLPAKAEFMAVADGWLIAFAKAKNRILVTQETPQPQSLNKVKIPDVCNGIGVRCIGTFDLLRALNVDLKI
jgi:hypothetical protein